MTQIWFSQEVAPFFSLLSLLAVSEVLLRYAERGTRRRLVYSTWYAALGLAAVLVGAAAIALVADQPTYVPATLGFAGAVIGGVFGWYLPIIARLYRTAELRGTIASDL
jgi:hypothetical protein